MTRLTLDATTPRSWIFLLLAWIVALSASLGALFVGEVMGQAPCNLCWYQRVFMFPLAIILGVGCFQDDAAIGRYALPLGFGGALIAGFHALLYGGVIPQAIEPCGRGPSCSSAEMTILGSVPLPYLSFAAFVAVILLISPASKRASA